MLGPALAQAAGESRPDMSLMFATLRKARAFCRWTMSKPFHWIPTITYLFCQEFPNRWIIVCICLCHRHKACTDDRAPASLQMLPGENHGAKSPTQSNRWHLGIPPTKQTPHNGGIGRSHCANSINARHTKSIACRSNKKTAINCAGTWQNDVAMSLPIDGCRHVRPACHRQPLSCTYTAQDVWVHAYRGSICTKDTWYARDGSCVSTSVCHPSWNNRHATSLTNSHHNNHITIT